jgi:predicted permease
VEPGFFRTLHLPLAAGRDFNDGDTATSPRVVIVNEAAARLFWPAGDGLGRQVELEEHMLTVVGVAKDARLMSLGEPAQPYLYLPLAQQYLPRVSLLVRTTSDRTAIPAVRQLVRAMNPNLPVSEAMPLTEITAIGVVPQRIAAAVAGSLGLVGLLLASIGIYGVTAYSVARRTREIGIRMALGADRSSVLALVLRQGFVLAAIGVAIGVGLSALASRLVESLLFGVPGVDPVTFAGACALFALVTLVATYIPARRAARVDPLRALRVE